MSYDLKDGHLKFEPVAKLLSAYASGEPLQVDPEFVYLGVLLETDCYERLRFVNFNNDADFVEIAVTTNDLVREPMDQISWFEWEAMLLDEQGYAFMQKYCTEEDLKAMQFTKIVSQGKKN